jgi:hypothetical protein
VLSCHAPPRAVLIPLAFNAAATDRGDDPEPAHADSIVLAALRDAGMPLDRPQCQMRLHRRQQSRSHPQHGTKVLQMLEWFAGRTIAQTGGAILFLFGATGRRLGARSAPVDNRRRDPVGMPSIVAKLEQ